MTNPVFQGGLGLMVVGGALALLRNAPAQLWRFATRGVWLEVFIDGWDPGFFWVNQWLAQRPEVQKSNMLRVESRWYDDAEGSRSQRRSTLIPGVGQHLIKFENARFWFSVSKESQGAPKGGAATPSDDNPYRPYNITIRVRKKHRKALLRLLEQADSLSTVPDPNRTRVYLPSWERWALRSVQHVRKAESVVLEPGMYERLVASLQKFDGAESWYSELGIPYRKGYLLYGQPGNGKSSLVLALAGVMHRDLYVLSLGDHNMDDNRLLQLMSSVPPKAIVLVEDGDTVFNGRKRLAENKLTFSGVLNAIDGALASEGRILFMTANHREQLDEALVRPGRCDEHVELKNAVPDQAERLFRRFFPSAPELAKHFASWAGDGTRSMAALQGHLIAHHTKVDLAAGPPLDSKSCVPVRRKSARKVRAE